MPEKHVEVDAMYELSKVLQCDLDRRVVGILLSCWKLAFTLNLWQTS